MAAVTWLCMGVAAVRIRRIGVVLILLIGGLEIGHGRWWNWLAAGGMSPVRGKEKGRREGIAGRKGEGKWERKGKSDED